MSDTDRVFRTPRSTWERSLQWARLYGERVADYCRLCGAQVWPEASEAVTPIIYRTHDDFEVCTVRALRDMVDGKPDGSLSDQPPLRRSDDGRWAKVKI